MVVLAHTVHVVNCFEPNHSSIEKATPDPVKKNNFQLCT